MATIPEMKMTVTVEVKKTRRVSEGGWREGFECPECGLLSGLRGGVDRIWGNPSHAVCVKCGHRAPNSAWKIVVMRWVRVKAGWFKTNSYWEKKVD